MNRRKNCRVAVPIENVYIWILNGSVAVPAQPLNLSSGGASISVAESCLTRLIVGHQLLLQLSIPRTKATLEIECFVKHVDVRNNTRLIGVEFLQPDTLDNHLPAFAFSNRRISFRAPPTPGEEISVSIHRPSDLLRLQMKLLDISVDGLAGICRDACSDMLTVGDGVTANFSLASVGRDFELDCIVRDLSPGEHTWRIGMSFVQKSASFSRQQKAIMNYVALRHEQVRLASQGSPLLET